MQPGDEDPTDNEEKMDKVAAHQKKIKEAADAVSGKKKAEETKKADELKLIEEEKKEKEKAEKVKADKEKAKKLAERKKKEEEHKLEMGKLRAKNKKQLKDDMEMMKEEAKKTMDTVIAKDEAQVTALKKEVALKKIKEMQEGVKAI